jgi:hypothetical protein
MEKFHHKFFFLKSPSNNKKTGENVNPWLSDPLFAKPTKKRWTQNSFMFFMGHVARSATLICCQSQRTKSDSILREKKKVFLSLREAFSDSQFQGFCHRLFPLLSSCLQGEWYMYHMCHLVSMPLQHKCTGLVLQSPVQLHPQSSITPHPTPISQQQNPHFPNP